MALKPDKNGVMGTPSFGASEKKGGVFVNPSAPGPTQKVLSDGTVVPGKAHEAKEGVVTNPGVRRISSASVGPRCPQCNETTLKMRMNKKAGERVYCSNPGCGYDQSSAKLTIEGELHPNPNVVKVVSQNSVKSTTETGVKILRQRRTG